MNELVKQEPELPGMLAMAKTLIGSGFLPSAIKTPEQAVAIILTGKELGIPTMQALRQINVIQGKPTMAAELMLAMAYQHIPGFKYAVVESTADHCTCRFERPGHDPLVHTFSMADAKGMGLTGKDNWNKQPATMLRWRCISSGLRLVCPDAIAGVYTPEELSPDSHVNFESGVLVAEPVSTKPAVTMPQALPAPEPVIDATPEPAPAPPRTDVISEAQRKRLFAISKANGYTPDDVKDYLKVRYQIESTSDIKKADYEAIVEIFSEKK